ncbi:MAG TPA: DUF6119 family protein [Gammaproteobacteria bacterium]|nr:DUF6119 family protein [Gammaproteobacteria bacterium]
MQQKTYHLTVRLLKTNVSADSALKRDFSSSQKELRSDLPFQGSILVLPPSKNEPDWVEFLNSCSASDIGNIINRGSSAILFVEASNRLFAFTFGYGHHSLSPDCHETDFGLKVTLNSVDPDKIDAVDAKTIDENMLTTVRQSSKSSTIESFGLNVASDLVRASTGVPKDVNLATRLTGREALQISAKINVTQLV